MPEKYEEKVDTASRAGGQGHASGSRYAPEQSWKSDATLRPERCGVTNRERWKTAVEETVPNVGTMSWPDQEKLERDHLARLVSPFDFVPA